MALFGKKDIKGRPPEAPAQTVQKAAVKIQKKDMAQDTTYFGKNLKIKGNVSGQGSLIILGSFEGDFVLKGRLKVAQGAHIKGDIKATDVYVNGAIEGAITASEKVHLDSTARIKGGIVTPRLSVLEGAKFDGELQMGHQEVRTSQASSTGGQKPAAPSPVTPAKKETELK